MNLHNLFSKEPLDILGLLPDSVIVGHKSFIYVPVFVSSARIVETEKISTERDIGQNFLVSTNIAEITVYIIFNFLAI